MVAIPWPTILKPAKDQFQIINASASGGRSPTGLEQVVVGAGSYWKATLTVPMRGDDTIRAFRALIAGLDGRAGTVLVGPWEYPRVPWAVDSYGRRVTPALRRRPRLDGTPYADAPGLIDGLVTASLAASAAQNATSCTIAVATGGKIESGTYFEVAGRLHLITAITATAGANTTVSFRPWLRADYAAGTAVDLVSPSCTMRLATDDTAALELELARFGQAAVELVEAF